MPNWCDNGLTVSHPDKEMMRKFAEGVKNGNLFATFIPMPEELNDTTSPSEPNEKLIEKYGASDWYSWNINNWGTKWDVCEGAFDLEEDELSGSGWFSTAWSPPTRAYEKLQELGFSIDAGYLEPGISYVGTWVDGDEEYVENYQDLFVNEDWRNEFTGYILDQLECEYENWLEYQEEEKDTEK